MNANIKDSFSRIKPVCDVVMVCPSPESITNFVGRVTELRKEVVQELQQYLLFPFITHLKSTEMEKKYELQWRLVDGMRIVLEKVTVNSYEMCMKIETSLLQLVFDNAKPGMIAEVPEELKHSVMNCLTVLMLNIEKRFREKLLRTQVPLVAQAVFVAVHLAKLEKHRPLRLAAINCVMAHTVTHPQLMTDQFRIADAALEAQVVDMLASILPGVLAALQDVAMCTNNPGHAVVVASLEAIHRILCLTMSDRYLSRKSYVTAEDFAKIIKNTPKIRVPDPKEVSCKEIPKAKDGPKRNLDVPKKDALKRSSEGTAKNKPKRGPEAKDMPKRSAELTVKEIPKRSTEWYRMAGDKLTLITKSIISLRMHEHYKVRKELAVFCSRILTECTLSMQPSIPICLDIVISLARDEYPMVGEYASAAVNNYFASAGDDTRHRTMDNLCENFYVMLNGLPRILNNIDSNRKMSALNLLYGYLHVMCDSGRPQRLTAALTAHHYMRAACHALAEAAALETRATRATRHARADITHAPVDGSPWCKFRLLEGPCVWRLREVCGVLGGAECSDLMLDRLLQLFQHQRGPELVCIVNWMAASPNSSISFVTRVLETYIEESVWSPPLELGSTERPLSEQDTYDVDVHDPQAWTTDRVPDLYEGTVETRYTGVSYSAPRPAPYREPNRCATLAEAQNNLLLSCLLTEGVGVVARRLQHHYHRHQLNTLCLLLERVGSKYELLHLAGLQALGEVARACDHQSVAELVAGNADYFTHQVTVRLKKSWNTESALQILSVVMEYSDPSILDCLYGIVNDVLVQSCDKYYEKHLYAYLQVFLTFVECIRKWFPPEDIQNKTEETTQNFEIDLTGDLIEYIKNTEEVERLMSNEEFEKESGKSVEEMYREDLKNKEDNELDYDDRVTTEEKQPVPQHVTVAITIMKRCLQFVSARRDCSLLALHALHAGLPLLAARHDLLLPLVHAVWTPLVARFESGDPLVMRRALALLVTMARLAEDFILSRCVKEVLPHIYKFLDKSSRESVLKDAGSAYRSSHAYSLQVAALEALPPLAVSLRLEGGRLNEAMASVDAYLSNKQPKPLQALAVNFFKVILQYDYGAAWWHLRVLCDNNEPLQPPHNHLQLCPVAGSPHSTPHQHLDTNIKLIFNHAIS